MCEVVINAVDAIAGIGKKANGQFENIIDWVGTYIGRIAIKSINNRLINEAQRSTENLGDIGLYFSKRSLSIGARAAAESLEKVASACIVPEQLQIACSAIMYLRNIGAVAASNRLPGPMEQTANSLQIIIGNSIKYERFEIIPQLVEAFGYIGKEYIKAVRSSDDEFAGPVYTVADRLDKVIEIVVQKSFDQQKDVLFQASKYLGELGQMAAKKGLAGVASRVALAFGSYGHIIDKEIIKKYLKLIIEGVDEVGSTDKRMAVVYFHVARTYNALNCFPEAERASIKATEMDPQRKLAWLQLHNALLPQGKDDEAATALATYKKL